MEEIHHFGLTVHEQRRSRSFYAGVLGLPWMGEFVNRGERFESMYKLKEAVNRVTWYQIGREGMETFYLSRHPAYTEGVGDIGKPGYRYISFWVDGFEKYIERLGRQGLEIRMGEGAAGPCSRICDPDGMNVLLFDSGRAASPGHISSLKEIGLVVSDAAGYEKFFETIGLWR
ncbi:MAG TPA: VOC family protein, partial [bacterium]|nr:VOC family protein [bacterium]